MRRLEGYILAVMAWGLGVVEVLSDERLRKQKVGGKMTIRKVFITRKAALAAQEGEGK